MEGEGLAGSGFGFGLEIVGDAGVGSGAVGLFARGQKRRYCRCKGVVQIHPRSPMRTMAIAVHTIRATIRSQPENGMEVAWPTPKTSVVMTRPKQTPPRAQPIQLRPAFLAIRPNQMAVISPSSQGTNLMNMRLY